MVKKVKKSNYQKNFTTYLVVKFFFSKILGPPSEFPGRPWRKKKLKKSFFSESWIIMNNYEYLCIMTIYEYLWNMHNYAHLCTYMPNEICLVISSKQLYCYVTTVIFINSLLSHLNTPWTTLLETPTLELWRLSGLSENHSERLQCSSPGLSENHSERL